MKISGGKAAPKIKYELPAPIPHHTQEKAESWRTAAVRRTGKLANKNTDLVVCPSHQRDMLQQKIKK